jgi:hypothetical protein
MADVNTQNIVAIISAFGGGAVLVALTQALIRWFTGRAGREQRGVAYERKLRHEAEDRIQELEDSLDHEISVRRRQAEYSSRLRRILIEKGIPEAEIPAWPVDAATLPRREVNRLVKEADPRFKEHHD